MYINENIKNSLPFKNLNDIYVVADFDRTITKGNSKTSWSILANSNLVPKSYIEERQELYDYYRPIEIDENMDFELKSSLVKEWFKKHIELFVKYKTSEEVFETAATDLRIMEFRPGAKEFIHFLNKNGIPLIIISAGLGNFIEIILKHNDCLLDNVYISSNKIVFKDGIACGVDNNIIHSLNKNEVSLPNLIQEKIKNRNNVILLGDQVSDLRMVDKNAHDFVLNIGFYTDDNHEQAETLKSNFDIVCESNDDYNDLRKLLFENKKNYLWGTSPFERTGFSEVEGNIPLSYKILVSQNSENCIDYVKGSYKRGKKRLFEFLDFILEQDLFEKDKLLLKIQNTKKFLNSKDRITWINLKNEQLNLEGEPIAIQNKKLLENEILNIEDVIEREVIKLRKLKSEKREDEMWKILGIDYWSDDLEAMHNNIKIIPNNKSDENTTYKEKYGIFNTEPAYFYCDMYRLTDGISISKREINEIIKIISNNNLKEVQELRTRYDIKNIEEIIGSALVKRGYGFYLENSLKKFIENVNAVCDKLNYNINLVEDDITCKDDEKIKNRRKDYVNTNVNDICILKSILNLKGYTIISIGEYEYDIPIFIIPIEKQEILKEFDENQRKNLFELIKNRNNVILK